MPELAVNSVLEFTQRNATITAVWLDVRGRRPAWLVHHLEAGYHTPFIAIDRRTERYPLVATIYWREPEVHLAYECALDLGSQTLAGGGLSFAMMRPIGRAAVQESSSQTSTIAVVTYDRAAAFSTRAPVLGAKAQLASHGAELALFGFLGRLGSERGTDTLRSNFSELHDSPGICQHR